MKLLSDTEKKLVARLGGDLPDCEKPFEAIAQELGMSEQEILERIDAWKSDGTMRRFGALLRHVKAGYEANAMVVWRVDRYALEESGRRAARFPQVSHCYARRCREGWPYNLYTMVHGRTGEECRAVVEAISREIGVRDYRVLPTQREFKKTSMVYFGGR